MTTRTFHFIDELATLIGHDTLEFDADTPLLLLSALRHQFPDFAAKAAGMKIGFVVKENGEYVSPRADQFSRSFGDQQEIYVVATVEGSGIETAAIALAAAIGVSVVTATVIIIVAASVVVGLVVASMAPTPGSTESTAAPKSESYIWSGVENTVEQGRPVPLVFGTFLVGSTVISSDILVDEERLEYPTPPASPAPIYDQPYTDYGGGA